MFLIQTADMERIVLSNRYVDEIRLAPESQLSVREGMCEVQSANSSIDLAFDIAKVFCN